MQKTHTKIVNKIGAFAPILFHNNVYLNVNLSDSNLLMI